MKIGELAAAADCEVQTIRFYERSGLLPSPERTTSNYRTYGPRQLERLRFIRRCRSLDMTLDEIRTLLDFLDHPQRNCGEVNSLLDDHLGHVRARIDDLLGLEKQLKALRRQCRAVQPAAQCGILAKLVTEDRPKVKGHVRRSH